MYCSNQSSMAATLLQQKSFMKNLTNGTNNDDGQNTPVMNNTGRLLLPHEIGTHTSLMTHQQQQMQQQQNLMSPNPATTITSFPSTFNNQFINHLQTTNSQQLFINNHQTIYPHMQPQFTDYNNDVNNILRPVTTTSNSMQFTSSSLQQQSNIFENGQQQQQSEIKTEAETPSRNSEIEAEETEPAAVAEQAVATATAEEDFENEPEIDIVINNVVCSFSVRCHLNLKDIALNGFNVEFRRENGMVTMKLRQPYTTASIWSSGKITCTGATSEDQAKIAARRYSRCLEKLGYNVKFRHFRIVNVLGTCSMPWAIKIFDFSNKYKKEASYEPELHPGVTYKLITPKATLKIFSTGSITVTAASVAFVQAAIEHIFPLVYEFRKRRTPAEKDALLKTPVVPVEPDIEPVCDLEETTAVTKQLPQKAILNNKRSRYNNKSKLFNNRKRQRPAGKADNDPKEDMMYVSDNELCSDDELFN